jgi:hypothetical protein
MRWRSKPTTPRPATSTGSPFHGSGPSGPQVPTMPSTQALWATFVSTTLGSEVPVLSSLPRNHDNPLAKCGCRKHCMDLHGDHTSRCTDNSGATKAHDWMVEVLGPLFRTAGHTVCTQHSVTASAGQRRGDVEIRNYIRDQAGSRSLVFDLSITHDRFGSSSHVQQNGLLSHPQDLDAPLCLAAQRKINKVGNNTLTIRTFLFSPHARRVFASSFSTGPPGDRGALHCRWNVIATQRLPTFLVHTFIPNQLNLRLPCHGDPHFSKFKFNRERESERERACDKLVLTCHKLSLCG